MNQMTCPKCSIAVQPGWSFCPGCKAPLTGAPSVDAGRPVTDSAGWTRGADDLAVRVDLGSGTGAARSITVEEGTRGLLFLDGRLAETLEPGRHKVGSIWERLTGRGVKTAVVVLIRIADSEIEFQVGGLRTQEQIPFTVRANLVFKVGDPDLFFVNLLPGRERLDIGQLRTILFDETRNALEEVLAGQSADRIGGDLQLKKQMELQVEEHLKRSLSRDGLELVQFRALRYTQDELDGVRDAQAGAEIKDRQLTAEEREIQVEHREIDVALKRNEVRERVRQAVNSDAMAEVRTGEQLKDFMHEIDKAGILREEEKASFVQAFDEKKADHNLARAHLLEKMDLAHSAELETLQADHREELDRRGLLHEIENRRLQLDADRIAHQAKMEKEDLEHQQDMKELEGMLGIRKLKEQQDAEHQARMQQVDLDGERARSEIGISELEAAARLKREEIEAFKGLTEEQILAIKAADTPALANALSEKFRAQAAASSGKSEAIEKLFREWMESTQKDKQAFTDFAKEALNTQMGAVSGVAGGAGSGSASGVRSGDVQVCSHCRFRIEAIVNARNCPNCGRDL